MASSEDPTSLRATKQLKVKQGSVTPKSKGKAVCLEGQSSEATRVPVVRGPEKPEEAVKGALKYFEEKRPLYKGKFPIKRYQLALMKTYPTSIYPTFFANATQGIMGPVPGVEVGLTVSYRDELRLLGIHRETQKGIDSMDYPHVIDRVLRTERAALCVVQSGVYQDCEDTGEVLQYVGEGGLNKTTNKQDKDQQKRLGNDALVNNCERGWLVRVVRGRKEPQSPSKMLYAYHGLYKVTKRAYVKGTEGFKIYKFTLERESKQKALAWQEWIDA